MDNRHSNLAKGMAALIEIIIISTAIGSIVSRQWRNLGLLILSAVCLIIPFVIKYIANRKKVILPPNFELVAVIFIFLAQYLGEIKKIYSIFWWWDLFFHVIFGSYGVVIGLHSVKRGLEDTLIIL